MFLSLLSVVLFGLFYLYFFCLVCVFIRGAVIFIILSNVTVGPHISFYFVWLVVVFLIHEIRYSKKREIYTSLVDISEVVQRTHNVQFI